ncbi:ABC transporter substrate-binding protein [Clostridium sp. BNL1100]|uniref:ABC transporter substrate-binding protein n=1 Tax=Clostridium sp. BNL1100 TaxID=755731 RepID=UPI00024A7949|nr:ABC transporter substrate-binding protein [Clostridium sp. BNL1100]AEY66550.1 putative periplasmic solute-binding protein [Clostridium sp. BNL1100]
MRKVHEKSILLGIGIGMIITAIAGMIYSGGTQKELTKDEIISRAKSYGLIEPVKLLNENNSAADSTVADTTSEKSPGVSTVSQASTEVADKASTANKEKTGTDTNERNIVIKIEDGHISNEVMKQLLDKGIITSEKDFTNVIHSYKASRKIISGTYKFKKNEDLDYLVKKICGIK